MSENISKEKAIQIKKIQYLRKNPDLFITKILGDDTLEDFQVEVCKLFAKYDRLNIIACHSVGKTFISARLALSFLNLYKSSKVITTAPTHRQVVTILWGEIRKSFKNSDTALNGKLITNAIQIDDDWFAMGFSPQKGAATDSTEQQGSSFQGFHAPYMLIIFDEATGITRDMYIMAEGLMTSGKIVKWLCISNPTTRACEAFKLTSKADWYTHRITCFDSPNMIANGFTDKPKLKLEISRLKNLSDLERLDRIKKYKKPNGNLLTAQWVVSKIYDWGFNHPLAMSKAFGEFPTVEDNTIIKWEDLQTAFNREVEPAPGDVRRIGIDVARFGEDSTVFTEMLGHKINNCEVHNKKSNTEVSGDATRFILETDTGAETHVIVDATGVGSGVVDILKDNLRDAILPANVFVFEVHYAQAVTHPDPEKEKELRKTYHNLKSYMFDMLGRDIREELDIPEREIYEEELPALLFTYSKQGKLLVEDKNDFKARYGKSPDHADSLALANVSKYLSKTHGSFITVSKITKPTPFTKRENTKRTKSRIKPKEY